MTAPLTTLNILHEIETKLPSLPRAMRSIGQAILDNPDAFVSYSLRSAARALDVSEPSILRFCRAMGFKGLPALRLAVAKSIGSDTNSGSVFGFDAEDYEPPSDAKIAIAKAAISLALDANSIILDSGSTVEELAKLLKDLKPKTIMTTGVRTLLKVSNFEQHSLMIPGGTIQRKNLSIGGRLAEDALSNVSFDVAFLGADVIHADHGVSTHSESESHLTRAIVRSANTRVFLAESSKFLRPKMYKICNWSEIDHFVTDSAISEEYIQMIESYGCNVIVAEAV